MQRYLLNPNTLLNICDQSRGVMLQIQLDIYYAVHFRLPFLFERLVLADGESFFRSVFFVGKLGYSSID